MPGYSDNPSDSLQASRSRIDEVVSILRATSDGDLLDPSDLGLLQSFVNGSFDILSDEGRLYWDKLLTQVVSGDYVKRWFCGIENLTRNIDGYVKWRDVTIEHYSHSDKDEMVNDARRLCAICLKIESDGGIVNSSSISKVLKSFEFAEGIETSRFIVLWNIKRESAKAAVFPLDAICSKTADTTDSDSDAFIQKAKSLFSSEYEQSEPRYCLVCRKEDLKDAIKGIEQDYKWAQRNFWDAYSNTEALNEMKKSILNLINPDTLISKWEIEDKIIGEFLKAVTEKSESYLILDPLQSKASADRNYYCNN